MPSSLRSSRSVMVTTVLPEQSSSENVTDHRVFCGVAALAGLAANTRTPASATAEAAANASSFFRMELPLGWLPHITWIVSSPSIFHVGSVHAVVNHIDLETLSQTAISPATATAKSARMSNRATTSTTATAG